jgi:outer membrane receptor protein involved in Fe transport
MRKLFCLTIILLLSVPYLHSQNYSLKGVILDNQSQKPLFYASVGLLNAEDSTSVAGVSSDEYGRFEISNVKQGNYLFQASYIGYEMYRVPFAVGGENKVIQIDTIRLISNATHLQAFTITEKKPVYMVDGEKTLYNVSEDPSIQTGTTADALQNAPGVEVDIEGNITLRGVSSVEIWINDQPSRLEAENLKTYLQQLPANSLERIEVITNPSARYSSEGTGGIINIITKTNIKKNSFISFGVNGSSKPMVSPWISYMWANEKFSINLYGYGYLYRNKSNSHGYSIAYDDNQDTSNHKTWTSKIDDFTFSGGLYFNGSYIFDTMNSLFFWGNGWGFLSDGNNATNQFHREYISAAGTYNYLNKQISDNSGGGGNMGVWYQHKINNKGHNLSASLNLNYNNMKWDTQLDRTYSNWINKDIHQRNDNGGNGLGAYLSFNYNVPYCKTGEIAMGVTGGYWQERGSNRTDTLSHSTEVYYLDSMRYEEYYSRTGSFDAYATIQQKFGNFTIKGGLRFEYRHYDYQILNSTVNNYKKDFWGLYPSLHLSYRTKSMHNFNLSYTRRVNIPLPSRLSTFIKYDLDSYSTGNPDLQPTYTNAIEGGWTKYFEKFGSVGLSGYFKNNKDEINQLTDVIYSDYHGRIVSFSIPVNSGKSHTFGAEANVMYKLKTFMNIRLYANIYKLHSETVFRENEKAEITDALTYSFRLNFWAKVWKFLEINASGNYRSKTKTLFLEEEPVYSINLGLRADFWKRKISVFLNVQDIFNWNKRETLTTNPYFEMYDSTKYTSRFISAGVTFRFGKLELEQQARTGGQIE